jgi:glutamyl-Q tRNA(Asp) synthetase
MPHSGSSWMAALHSRLRSDLPSRVPLRSPGWRTRFAPAPTGYLHLGHLVNAVCVWGLARAHGGDVLLRIEDHDRTRCRPEFEAALLDDLEWLGFAPDVYPVSSFRPDVAGAETAHPARQSDQEPRYAAALESLSARGLVYACACTRRDIAQLVPRAPGEEARYPGTCREAAVDPLAHFARRVRLPDVAVTFEDLRLGVVTQHPAQQCGDLLVRDRHAQWTYQFAVVVDDMAHEIDVVIRGEDLLASTGRQWALAALLGRDTPPLTLHHALITHADGSKLSKANRDTSLRELRAAGWSAERLIGEAAYRAGMLDTARALPAHAVADLFAASGDHDISAA